MSHHEEENQKHKKHKSGVVKAIFKLLTLGGLLVIVFRSFQKQKENQDK